uniref:Uncharacterized protein n=1 Tax=Arundo donax TaxID=35708 RepID=A0A0A9FXP4_ARUDO
MARNFVNDQLITIIQNRPNTLQSNLLKHNSCSTTQQISNIDAILAVLTTINF